MIRGFHPGEGWRAQGPFGQPERCDRDLDEDGIPDSRDPCPTIAENDPLDSDGDGRGDACDPDDDDDGVPDVRDDCATVADQDQTDVDRDGLGDACDERFCFMVGGPDGDEDDCLDPAEPLIAYSPCKTVALFRSVVPGLWVNREDAPLRYRWELLDRPSGSRARLLTPEGASRFSTPFQVHYLEGHVPVFVPDEPGRYRLRVTVELAFPDERHPDVQRAERETIVTAEGTVGHYPCSTSGAPGGRGGSWILVVLVGALTRARARSRRTASPP